MLRQRGWRTAFSVAERVDAWAGLVCVIERGYGDGICEYANDLNCRNWLHEAWLLLDDHIVQLWTPQIKALNDRYKAATIDDRQALEQFHSLPGPDLWWRCHRHQPWHSMTISLAKLRDRAVRDGTTAKLDKGERP